MSLREHALREVTKAGLLDADSDYGGMLGKAVVELVEVFSKQGHSGFSAGLALSIFEKLVRYKPLTPLTSDPEEWMDVGEMSGRPIWQSMRCPSVFSRDGGATWHDIDAPAEQPKDDGS